MQPPVFWAVKEFWQSKAATCYPGFESKLTNATVLNEDVVEDGNVITSKGLGTAIDFSLSIIKKLLDEDTAKKIAGEIMYRHYK